MSNGHACTISLPRGLSAVIPVYNSAQSLPILLEKLSQILPGIREPFEVILVNDGSRDQSWQVIQDNLPQYPFVRAIDLMRNYGQHNTLLCGIRAARYDIIVTLDDDLQNPPEEIPKLLQKLDTEKLDVVYGPPENEQHGLFRDLASVITKLVLQNAMGTDNARNISAYRVFRTQLRDAFSSYQSPYVSIDVLLTWATSKFGAVKVKHDQRTLGTSNYTFKKLVIHALNMLTGFSTVPLRVATMVGFAFTLLGLALLFYVIGRLVFTGSSVPGFPFLASMIAIFSGAQLFALGIIGEYMARLHFRMMDRPTYAVRSDSALQETNE